jgi:protein-disulfide isomerase
MTMTRQLVTPVTFGRDHIRGTVGAPVTLLEYGDYQCPHCAAAHAFVESVRQQAGDELQFAFRHFPMSAIHKRAERATEAAEAAGGQGQFWSMHDLLFENHEALEDDDLIVFAAEIGIDAVRFARDLASAQYAARVREDFLSGLESGVKATPVFFINNVRLVGAYDVDSLADAIQRALTLVVSRRPSSGARM